MRVSRRMFRTARRVRDLEVFLSLSPSKIFKHYVNKHVLKFASRNALFKLGKPKGV